MSFYPSSLATALELLTAVNNLSTTLSGDITDIQTTIPVVSTSNFPASGRATILKPKSTYPFVESAEVFSYTSKDATNFLGVTRGEDGTTKTAFDSGDTVGSVISSKFHNILVDELRAVLTDLRNTFSADLDDAQTPATTATNLKGRLDHLVTQLKLITGKSDWKTAPIAGIESILTTIMEKRNALTNPGFEIWQRGTSFVAPAHNDYLADKWRLYSTGGTVNVTRDTGADNGAYCMKFDVTVTGGVSNLYTYQDIDEDLTKYAGKTMTLSARVKSTAGIILTISDGVSSTNSTPHTGGGTYETLTVTHAMSGSSTNFRIGIGFVGIPVVVSTNYFDSVNVIIGSTAIPFVPENPAIEIAKCQRYYEKSDVTESLVALGSDNGVNYLLGKTVQFKVTKASVPTITSTLSLVQEEGSGADQKASYSNNMDSIDIGGYRHYISKAIAGNKPNLMRWTWEAEV